MHLHMLNAVLQDLKSRHQILEITFKQYMCLDMSTMKRIVLLISLFELEKT